MTSAHLTARIVRKDGHPIAADELDELRLLTVNALLRALAGRDYLIVATLTLDPDAPTHRPQGAPGTPSGAKP